MTSHPANRKWLLAIDGSLDANRAADYVARWAQAFGVAEVCLLNVQPLGSYRAYALNPNETLLEASERGTQATAVARRVLDEAKVVHRFHTEIGTPADAIVAFAQTEHVAEIFLGSRGLGTFASLALGSVAYKVIHVAEVAVTIVNNPRQEPHLLAAAPDTVHRVLLAVDGSDHADRAVHYVCRLAGEGIPIEAVLLNVQLPITSGRLQGLVSEEVIDSHYRDEGANALRTAQRALTKADIRFESEVMAGPLAPTIVRLAEERRCARIVMGTRGLGAIANVLLGSVAYKVLHLTAVPVTLVK